jgi:hypothetical protein
MSPPAEPREGQLDPAPFIVGMGRSGTTLLRLMLDAHPEMAIPPETHFLPDLIEAAGKRGTSAERLTELITSQRTWGDFGLDADLLADRLRAQDPLDARAAARAFYRLYADKHGKARWGDKTPGYVRRMRPIGDTLPEARFMHLIRDGRDVALSRQRRGMGAHRSQAEMGARWRDRIRSARRQAKRLRGRYLEVRYEDLVTDPEPSLRRVTELIELDWDPAMLDYHRRAGERLAEMERDLPGEGGRPSREGAERMRAHALAKEPPRRGRIGAWREEMGEADRAAFSSEAGELLAELGYEP